MKVQRWVGDVEQAQESAEGEEKDEGSGTRFEGGKGSCVVSNW